MINTPAKPTLLVVEDNAVIMVMLQRTIRSRRGASVDILTAGNGKEGIAAARRQRPDLVLLDWMMPDFNGEWFLKEQAQDAELSRVPVMVYSALSEKELKETLKKYPAVKQFLHKPFSPSKIFEVISPHLKLRRTEEEPPLSAAPGSPPA